MADARSWPVVFTVFPGVARGDALLTPSDFVGPKPWRVQQTELKVTEALKENIW